MNSFALSGRTGDGVLILLGGLCAALPDDEARGELREALQRTVFAPVDGDAYLTDVKVHRIAAQAAASCAWVNRSVAVLGAVAPFSCAESGAVLGAPFSAPESADGRPETIGNGCYALCRPGRYGAAFCTRSPAEAARLLRQLEEASVGDALKCLRGLTFLLVCDAGAHHPGQLFMGTVRMPTVSKRTAADSEKELL